MFRQQLKERRRLHCRIKLLVRSHDVRSHDQESEVVRTIQIAGITSALFAAVITSAAMAESVYRGLDEEGQVVYSDRPLAGYEEVFELDVMHSSADAIRQRRDNEERLAKAAGIRKAHEAEEAAEAANTQASREQARAKNCAAAKARSEKYNTHRRLYKENADGEREYLSGEELDAARAEAARTADEWCS
ncbi:MAG: DUF4124 domain-containing protein [Chromatiales bacterium]